VAILTRSLPAFDRARARLHRFLDAQHVRRPALRWIFREHVALRERSLLVSDRLPGDCTSFVAERYACAIATRAPAVLLGAEGIDDVAVYCTIFVPRSDDDAEDRMMAGLKLSILEPLPRVVTVDDATWRVASDAQAPEQVRYLDDRFQRATQTDACDRTLATSRCGAHRQ
jgi:hypothetical protein